MPGRNDLILILCYSTIENDFKIFELQEYVSYTRMSLLKNQWTGFLPVTLLKLEDGKEATDLIKRGFLKQMEGVEKFKCQTLENETKTQEQRKSPKH